jgi:purine nucleoside phosphorylase
MRLGVLAGSALPEGYFEPDAPVLTKWGPTSSGLFEKEIGSNTLFFIARHGLPARIPPHMVNHRANIQALVDRRVEGVISICSTGSLRSDIEIPRFAVPSDYIDLFSRWTFFDNEIFHTTPGFDPVIQEKLIDASISNGLDPLTECVYVQTRGPRLETAAEVELISGWGDIVGMNLGPEASLCSELQMRIGALITIDNYANGINDTRLDFRIVLHDAKSHWDMIIKILSLLPDGF